MSETRYMISDTAKKVDVETHVLRYWEEELELVISRTELGHRYYTEEDIRIFQNIKELKERGIQLKAIKLLIPELKKRVASEEKGQDEGTYNIINLEEKLSQRSAADESAAEAPPEKDKEKENEGLQVVNADLDKLKQFEVIVGNVFKQVLQENNVELEERITDSMVKEMDVLLQIREEREEERYRKLDAAIRSHQKKRSLVAATKEPRREKKRWFRR